MVKYIIVMGGVISGVGKGIATASIGKILQEYGYRVTAIKIDPYINVDASTLSPKQHGEVWVTADGGETDLDLGNYERFLDIELSKKNSITTGKIYQSVINKEREGFYNGETVQFIPHITNEIKEKIVGVAGDNDIVLIEIGGVVGDYENVPFLSAIKSLERDIGKENILYVLVTYMLIPSHIKEMKTKPTQTAIRELMQSGIIPDIILCRGKEPLDDIRKKKIETYVNIKKDYIISAPDSENIYNIPLELEKENLGQKILVKLNLEQRKKPDWIKLMKLINNMTNPSKTIKIAVVGKYLSVGNYQLVDSYISVNEAIKHATAHLSLKVECDWIDSTTVNDNNINQFAKYDGVIIPGGFGSTGVDGKLKVIQYVRENNIPFLGLCYGMQLAVIEYARNVCNLQGAHTTEVDSKTKYPIVDILEDQKSVKTVGGTLRLGAYPCFVKDDSLVYKLYKEFDRVVDKCIVFERHRHRYEISYKYTEQLEKQGLVFSGYYYDTKTNTKLMEYIELPTHKFFIGTQSHPEFTSNLLKPNPLFYGFLKACEIKK
jgi:CTP synthase